MIYMRESSKETFDITIPTHDPPYAQTPWFAHEQSDVKTSDDFLTTSNKRDETVLHRGFARELYIPQSGVLLGFK